jgi:uncharacterized SAM-binding protein YcdF (DUF218 family)
MGAFKERMRFGGNLNACLALMALVFVLFFSSKWGGLWLTVFLERSSHPLSAAQGQAAQAIVVLTGGDALVQEAARLHSVTGLPILASGGDREAVVIKADLEKRFRTPVKWTEEASRNTEENAKLSAEILIKAKVRRIILVTHALHMRRAQAMFVGQGFEVVPAPVRFSISAQLQWADCLPSAAGLKLVKTALHEVMGLAYYKVRQAILWTNLFQKNR